MALDKDNLDGHLVGGNRFWIYRTTDAIATVIAADYFLLATDRLTENDVIIVIGSTGGSQTVDLIVITAATTTTVTTTNGT